MADHVTTPNTRILSRVFIGVAVWLIYSTVAFILARGL